MKVKAAHYSEIFFLFLLLFLLTHISLANTPGTPGEEIEVQLIEILFQKETDDLDNGSTTTKEYEYSPSRNDLGQKGTFTEKTNSGVYELIWDPPRGESYDYIKQYLKIKAVLSGKYSSERKIETLEYTYLQDTDNPDNEDDKGIHTWVLKAKNIPLYHASKEMLVFYEKGAAVCDAIPEYEKINQGNPRFVSYETIKSCDDNNSGLTVELNIGTKWWINRPIIEFGPSVIDFGYGETWRIDKILFLYITNKGDQNLVVNSSITGPNADEFYGGPNRDTILPGQQVQFQIHYRPTRPGKVSAWLEISSNDPDEPVVKVHLAGYGYGSTKAPRMPPASIYLLLLHKYITE